MGSLGGDRYKYSHISAAATTNVYQTGPVLLHTITVNGSITGTATVIDGTTTTDASRATVAIINTDTHITRTFNAELSRGLVVVTDAAADLTVSWADI